NRSAFGGSAGHRSAIGIYFRHFDVVRIILSLTALVVAFALAFREDPALAREFPRMAMEDVRTAPRRGLLRRWRGCIRRQIGLDGFEQATVPRIDRELKLHQAGVGVARQCARK